MDRKGQGSVIFSGGSDSTLAAALMLKRFKKVHLLTFIHSAMRETEKSKINAKTLQDKFGEDRVAHSFINIEPIFKELYYGTYFSDLRRYGVYLAAGYCHACQLAMHTATILYNLKNNVFSASDGYKREKSHIYIFMANEGIKCTKRFYREYNIDYKNPVYDIPRTDWDLFDMGITSKRDVKFPHERSIYEYTTQPHCPHGVLQNAYLLGYDRSLYRRPHGQPPGIEYHKEKIMQARRYISCYMRARNTSSTS